MSSGLTFILYRYIVEFADIETLGLWSAVVASVSAVKIAELGMGSAVTRFVALYISRGDFSGATSVVNTAFSTLFVLFAVIITIAYFVMIWVFPFIFSISDLKKALAILPFALCSLWLSSIAGVYLGAIDGLNNMPLRAKIFVTGQLVLLICSICFLEHSGLIGLAMAQLISATWLVVMGWIALRYSPLKVSILPRHWSKNSFREIVKFGAHIQGAGIFFLMLDPITKAYLTKFGGPAITGYFEVANQLISRARALVTSANQAVIPHIAGTAEINGHLVKETYLLFLRITICVSIPMFAMLFSFGELISSLLIGEIVSDFLFILSVLIVGWTLNVLCAPAYFANQGRGAVIDNTLSIALMGIINTLAGFVFGQYFGWKVVILVYVLAISSGSFYLIIRFHMSQAIEFSGILSRDDIRLLWASLGVACLSEIERSTQIAEWTYHLITLSQGLLLAIIAARHPIVMGFIKRNR